MDSLSCRRNPIPSPRATLHASTAGRNTLHMSDRAVNKAKVLGIAGWSGCRTTTLLPRLIPLLVSRGLRVATLKHAHHAFDVDQPGKDSYEHRKSGAGEVIICSAPRWV